MDCSSPGSSIHGILQARILERAAISSSRASSRTRAQIHISCLLHWQVGSLPLVPPGGKKYYPSLNYQIRVLILILIAYSSFQFSCSVMSSSLWPHGLWHAWLPCPSPTPKACTNSYPSNQWCYPTISSSVIPFSSCLQSFPASGPFLVSQFFASAGQSIGVSTSASVLPMNSQDWSTLGWTGWISLQYKGLSSLLQYHSPKASILWCSALFMVQLSLPYLTTGKTIALTRWTFVGKVNKKKSAF